MRQVRTFVAWQVTRAAAGRPHFRVIERREDGLPVGHCGLKRVDDWPFAQSTLESESELEIGYMLDPDWWGHGYATEAAGSALADGFKNFGRERLLARANAENTASIAVMLRCGMTFEAEQLEDGKRLVQYQITRRPWQAGSAAP
jgi:ribosomal-protein-alanine N-acetyltransferase